MGLIAVPLLRLRHLAGGRRPRRARAPRLRRPLLLTRSLLFLLLLLLLLKLLLVVLPLLLLPLLPEVFLLLAEQLLLLLLQLQLQLLLPLHRRLLYLHLKALLKVRRELCARKIRAGAAVGGGKGGLTLISNSCGGSVCGPSDDDGWFPILPSAPIDQWRSSGLRAPPARAGKCHGGGGSARRC